MISGWAKAQAVQDFEQVGAAASQQSSDGIARFAVEEIAAKVTVALHFIWPITGSIASPLELGMDTVLTHESLDARLAVSALEFYMNGVSPPASDRLSTVSDQVCRHASTPEPLMLTSSTAHIPVSENALPCTSNPSVLHRTSLAKYAAALIHWRTLLPGRLFGENGIFSMSRLF